ncbi:MAG: LPS export ABC transporter periplasmic protein LptC [Candidatus Azotimanducaceae bacterium]
MAPYQETAPIETAFPNNVSNSQGDVVISRRTAEGQLVEIQSDNFILLPQKQYAETLSSVTLNSSNNLTRAGKLSIDLRRGEMRLQSSSTQYVETKIRSPQFGKR